MCYQTRYFYLVHVILVFYYKWCTDYWYSIVWQIANLLDRAVASVGRKPLKVFVQVNTSGEICKLHLTD